MPIKLEVWGEYACFTRPEMKVERVSYDVMTPSAARGIMEAIYWHPGLEYRIDRIRVCAPIVFGNIRRNEIKSKVSAVTIKKAMTIGEFDHAWASTSDDIQQRATLLLRNVHYVIESHFLITEKAAPSDNEGKFQDIIRRRIEKGQYYHQPYFGCREFPLRFKKCEEIPQCPDELKGERDLGYMLYDMDYSDTTSIKPMFFRAMLKDGLLEIPDKNSEEVVR